MAEQDVSEENDTNVLDLCSQDLEAVPVEIYANVGKFRWVTQLFLQFNSISSFPEDLPLAFPALTTLNVGGNELETLPETIGLLQETIQKLIADDNGLRHIPTSVNQLKRLRILRLRGNKLSGLDDSFGVNMSDMRELHVDDNCLMQLPSGVCFMTSLETLEAGDNKLRSLPEELGNLKNLQVLNLTNNQLTKIPASFSKLPSLTSVDLSHNMLTVLPDQLESSQSLESIYLNDNKLTDVPEWLSYTPMVEELDISNNSLQGDALPPTFGLHSPNMQVLGIESNHLTRLPESVCSMSQLRELKLGSTIPELDRRAFQNGNWLDTLPEGFGRLSKLEYLWLDENTLKILPYSFGSLCSLTFVDMCQNLLSTLPDSVCGLSSLVTLLLSRNQLKVLPCDFGNLTQLLEVRLDHNELQAIPDSFAKLTQLKTLDLYCNCLTAIPAFLSNFSQLSRLDLNRNVFQSDPNVSLSFCKKEYAERPKVEGWRGKTREDMIPIEFSKVEYSVEESEVPEPKAEMTDVLRRALLKGQSMWKSHTLSGERRDADRIFANCLQEAVQFEDIDNETERSKSLTVNTGIEDRIDSEKNARTAEDTTQPFACEEDWDAEIDDNKQAMSVSTSQTQYSNRTDLSSLVRRDKLVIRLLPEQRAMLRLTFEKGLQQDVVRDDFFMDVALQTEKSLVVCHQTVSISDSLLVEGQFDDCL